MSERTGIHWTDSTWNPIRGTAGRWHCVRVSPGCDNCYAAAFNMRLGGPDYTSGADTLRLDERVLMEPLRWKKPRMIFVCSMTDLFMQEVPDAWIERIFQVMLEAPHTFQVLTKRPDRMRRFCERFLAPALRPAIFENIWLGTTIERDDYAWRADHLRRTPAVVRWVSAEPLLGPLPSLDLTDIDWLVTGGESGRGYRRMDPTWAIDLRDRCQASGTAFFHKQGSAFKPGQDRELDGRLWDAFPAVRP